MSGALPQNQGKVFGSPTVDMLMKMFYEKGEVNVELELRKYMLEKGYCPHGHTLELFTTALCVRRRANDSSRQTMERGRFMSKPALLLFKWYTKYI